MRIDNKHKQNLDKPQKKVENMGLLKNLFIIYVIISLFGFLLKNYEKMILK